MIKVFSPQTYPGRNGLTGSLDWIKKPKVRRTLCKSDDNLVNDLGDDGSDETSDDNTDNNRNNTDNNGNNNHITYSLAPPNSNAIAPKSKMKFELPKAADMNMIRTESDNAMCPRCGLFIDQEDAFRRLRSIEARVKREYGSIIKSHSNSNSNSNYIDSRALYLPLPDTCPTVNGWHICVYMLNFTDLMTRQSGWFLSISSASCRTILEAPVGGEIMTVRTLTGKHIRIYLYKEPRGNIMVYLTKIDESGSIIARPNPIKWQDFGQYMLTVHQQPILSSFPIDENRHRAYIEGQDYMYDY